MFWELLKESVIIQGVMALSIVGAVIYMVVTKQEIPSILLEVLYLILGFYFGSKTRIGGAKHERDSHRAGQTGDPESD